MKPFSELVRDRCADPEKATVEALKRLERWRGMSGSKMVTLDEVAWIGAIFAMSGVYALDKLNAGPLEKKTEGNVTTVIAGDGVGTRDFV